MGYVDKKAAMWAEKDFVLPMVQLSGKSLQYAADSLKGDRDIALAAFKRNSHQYVSKTAAFWRDKECVLPMVKLYGPSLEYASDVLKIDRDFILAVVGKNGDAFQYVDKKAGMWA